MSDLINPEENSGSPAMPPQATMPSAKPNGQTAHASGSPVTGKTNGHSAQPWNWRESWRDAVPNYPAIQRRQGSGPVPASYRQEELWVLSQFEEAHVSYNIFLGWRIRGPLNQRAVQQTLDALVARHESLRTIFPVVDGQPMQQVVPADPAKLEVVDLQQVSAGERESQLEKMLQQRIRYQFDLEKEILFRPTLFKLQADEHVLLLLTHHIVGDGTSAGIMTMDVGELYNAFNAGKPSPLAPLPVQYADYSVWQREWLTSEIYSKQLTYWKRQLQGAPALLELPVDHPRQSTANYRGRMQFSLLEPALMKELRALSRREGVTLFMTMLAAYQTLLHRHSGQAQVVVGSPISYRNRVELQRQVGFFINILPLYTDLSGDPSFRDLLKRVREMAIGAFAHQDVPFGRIVQELHPDRNLGASPLVQAILVQEQASWRKLKLDGLETQFLWLQNGTAKFDLVVYFNEDENGIAVTWEYSDLFDQSTIARMAGHFRELLLAVVADSSQPLSRLPLLTQAENRQLLQDWNQTDEQYPDLCLHQWFEQQAQRTPNEVAVVFGDQRITYAELNARANQLARYLRNRSVTTETLVGLSIERSIDMMVGLLGIQKAGGVYVPLDPAFPRERIGFIIQDAKAPILITQESLLTSLPEHSAEVICLDADWDAIAQESAENLASISKPENLIYVLYTSGSTGNPKGVQLEHRNVVNFLNTILKQPGLSPKDVLLAVTTLSFDIAGLELYLPLVTGARVVIASKDEASDGGKLMALLKRHHATVMQATPATWRLLLDMDWPGNPKLKILCGGEALPHDLAEQLLPRCSELWNMYGPTETTIWSSVYKVEHGMPGVAPIGRPIGNNTMYILDAHKAPMPVGVPGELYIGGDGVARGYLGRPELTAERFIPDPFSSKPGARMYRTGDLTRYLADGNIQFLGRADFQVKVRGFRIELGEIEAVLGKCPGVAQNVVVVREDKPCDKRLAAYVIRDGGIALTGEELRDQLRQKLPEYMVPSTVVFMEEFPLTPNGKVDRRALPAPEYKREEADAFVGPRNQTEARLAEIWERVLGVSPVSVTDNFFELGGHSLLGSRLFAQVETVFGRKLPLATLFSAPTIELLAKSLGADQSAHWLVEIQSGGSKPPFFFVHARMGYRLLAQELGPDQPVYVLPYDDMFDKKLERPLEEIAGELVSRMRSFQPKGPYYLGGMCLAGRVAYAMAQELHAQGEEVALLALFDSPAPGYPSLDSNGDRMKFLTQKVKKHLFNFSQQEGSDGSLRNWLRWHMKNGMWKASFKLSRVLGKPLPLVKSDTFRLMGRSASAYRPSGSYPGLVTLFRPANLGTMRYPDPDTTLGWKRMATGGADVYEVPGGHTNFLKEPAVHLVAKALAESLLKAQARAEQAAEDENLVSA